jgi:hypothetical protein
MGCSTPYENGSSDGRTPSSAPWKISSTFDSVFIAGESAELPPTLAWSLAQLSSNLLFWSIREACCFANCLFYSQSVRFTNS